jgi:hypothetical protein
MTGNRSFPSDTCFARSASAKRVNKNLRLQDRVVDRLRLIAVLSGAMLRAGELQKIQPDRELRTQVIRK